MTVETSGTALNRKRSSSDGPDVARPIAGTRPAKLSYSPRNHS
ncbi:hypothetical protein [Parasphingorhabdus sp.]